ncbi:transcription termination factor [Novosphingobium sp. Rr 2-17]|uniref:transcription antitermination factor NusB n=1 Tax=Novosphingobium sp. Rr 2-17 TaxID=555793 RepID=UPI0002698B7E|nr:transcription antitermination factor NusB [Novosphingobium sp. Rr 2-17]EIZ80594.1 transcription termination factor [Novosphingobium sp. Rr 2-17]
MTTSSKQKRAAARLLAVQALYQFDMEGTKMPTLLDEFHRHRAGMEIDEAQFAQAEITFFDDIVQGTVARRDEIDALISARLTEGWSITRLDKTQLQILRAGVYELLARRDVPIGAVISEYLDVSHAFFDARETKFVNGVLDAVAKDVR